MSYHKIVELDNEVRGDVQSEPTEDLDNLELEMQEIEESYAVPEKFKDKSKEDIAKAYADLEKALGRQGQELGQMRKYVDSLIQREVAAPEQSVQEKPIEADDLLDHPEETVKSIVRKELESLQGEIKKTKERLDYDDFVRRHPNYQEVAQSEAFMDWVQKSDRRTARYNKANYEMDLDAADDLLSDWADTQAIREQYAQQSETKRKKALKQATAERGAVESGGGKKKFTKSELRDMRIFRPDQFNAMQAEIIEAYREGRVIEG